MYMYIVQLEACLLESQNKAFYLQKEVGLLREQLQERERGMEELNKEIASLKEELAIRWAMVTYFSVVSCFSKVLHVFVKMF